VQKPLPAEASVTVRGLKYLRDQPKSVSLRALEPAEVGVPSGLAAPLVEPLSHPTDAATASHARPPFQARTEDGH